MEKQNFTLPGISWQKFQSLIAILLLSALLALLTDNFLTTENIWNVLRQISVNVCISVGLTLVILTAGIDLSVGSVLAFGGGVTAGLLQHGGGGPVFYLFIGFTVMGVRIAGFVGFCFFGWFDV